MQLVLSGVGKRYGSRRTGVAVLENISLSVASGDFVAVVGSSGSGKSTLLRLVAGLEAPTTGTLLLDDAPISGPGHERGMVFQNYSLYPWLTAAQNVAFGMRLQGRSKPEIHERTAYFLEVVGLSNAARLLPRELSGGMQQRIAIARALAAEPKVLLLDEPFGALDVQIRETLQEFLHNLWKRTGLTALLITHDLEEALLLAQRVHILAPRPGRIVRSVEVPPLPGPLSAQRLSPAFLALREELAGCLRGLEGEG
jgi:NitT/TauT family transport system ATP-binding protein